MTAEPADPSCQPLRKLPPNHRPGGMPLLALLAIGLCSLPGCGGGGGGGSAPSGTGPGGGAGATSATVLVGASGSNQGGTLPSGVTVKGAAIVGETVSTQTGTATSPTGVQITVRHGFHPGSQVSTPAGNG